MSSTILAMVLSVGSLVVAYLHKRGKDKAADQLAQVLDVLRGLAAAGSVAAREALKKVEIV